MIFYLPNLALRLTIVNGLLKNLEYLNKTVDNELIKTYLKSKEEKHKINISVDADFTLLTDDLIDDYVIHKLLEVELGDDVIYYEKMKKLYSELF